MIVPYSFVEFSRANSSLFVAEIVSFSTVLSDFIFWVSALLQEITVRIDNATVMVILFMFMFLIFHESKLINHNFSLVIN